MDSPSTAVVINFANVPASALNISRRLQLSWHLNPEQQLLCNNLNITRDYRGLAELMGFEYTDIRNFQRFEDPTAKILEAWVAKPNTTIADLVTMLEKMERYDVVEDVKKGFETDANEYLKKHQLQREIPLQVPEVGSSCRAAEGYFEESPDILTIDDSMTGELTRYDAYVCYADEDSAFVHELAKYLESYVFKDQKPIKLCIRGRDLLIGTCETDAHIKLIQDRCDRMLIVLSPNFLKSKSCEFHASFAAGLAIEQQKRKLIPLVLAPCEIPMILRFVTKIDFTKPDLYQWMWNKLILSIRSPSASAFVAPSSSTEKYLVPQLEPRNVDISNPVVTFPPTVSITPGQPNTAIPSSSSQMASICSTVAHSDSLKEPVPLLSSKISPPLKQSPRWYQNLKYKFGRSATTSASTSASSGFHSQSGDVFDSSESSGYANNTPL